MSDQFEHASFQMHRRAVSGVPGHRLHLLGSVGESCSFDCYDDHISHHCLSEASLHKEIYLMCYLFFYFNVPALIDALQK